MSLNSTPNLEWMNRLAEVECRDATYKPKSNPVVFAKAKGSLIWDSEGREYVDLCAGFGALPLGHNGEALQKALSRHLEANPPIEHAMGDVYPSVDKILFLEALQRELPSRYRKGALALSGGQAVELALKTAMLRTKASGFIVFSDAYHGLDLGVLPLTSREDFRRPFKSWLKETAVLRLPYGVSKSEVEACIRELKQKKDIGFAAVVAEPLQGRAGVNPPPEGWLSELADVCHQYDGLLVLDEVFTGFGRIGSITSAENVEADILCFGKAIGGGFPISACFATDEVMAAWPESPGEALHTGTFFGHPLSAAVGRFTIEQIMRQDLCGRSRALGETLKMFLRESLNSCPLVKDIRGAGLMIGIEMTRPGLAAELMDELRSEGVIVLPSGNSGHVLSLTPALIIGEELLLKSCQKVVQAVRAHTSGI